MTANDQFLLLACDGLFDVFLEEDDLINFIKNYMLKHGDTQKCCQVLLGLNDFVKMINDVYFTCRPLRTRPSRNEGAKIMSLLFLLF